MTEHVLELPYRSPPLNLNHRHTRWAHAAIVKQLRHDTWALAKHARIGHHQRVDVALHWQPGRRGTYDEDNPTPTLKACADGLVDAGVTTDDDRTRMTKRVVIHDPRKPGRLWLVVTPIEEEGPA
jgi:crossover junction endodeoxyribonuclease RusA